MVKVLFSYSHKDEALRDELDIHLSPLKREGIIQSWHDRRILAGSELDGTISENLESADIILLLVSPYFLASSYCCDVEMKRAMERHEAQEALVIPVILNPCDWQTAPFGKLLAVPTDGRPITKFPNIHDGFLEVAKALREVFRSKAPADLQAPPIPVRPLVGSTPVINPDIRSSNLRVRRSFADHDRHAFRDEAFEYICNFFEGSLTELQQRNPDISTRFKRVDSERFTVYIYQLGKLVSQCGVRLGNLGRSSEIVYSSDPNSTTSYNESMSVSDNGTSMFLKTSGMSMFGDRRDQELNFQGAAEVFWAILMRPLQN